MMKLLTEEQNRVLSFVTQHQKERGAPPTVREICLAMGYSSLNSVRQHLRLIEQKGYIRLLKGLARGIELLVHNQEERGENELMVPFVGTVAAGKPITAQENLDGHIVLDKNLFKGEGLFTLRIKGDSMEGIGVLDGDIIIVRQQPGAQNNEIVVVIIEGEATLKRYIKNDTSIVLRPENPKYKDIVIPPGQNVWIAGKMVGVMRKC
jgi:repressor LexA